MAEAKLPAFHIFLICEPFVFLSDFRARDANHEVQGHGRFD